MKRIITLLLCLVFVACTSSIVFIKGVKPETEVKIDHSTDIKLDSLKQLKTDSLKDGRGL